MPTGKDSLSMTQKYPDGKVVYSPGTVIISAVGEVTDIRKEYNSDLEKESGYKNNIYRFFKFRHSNWEEAVLRKH